MSDHPAYQCKRCKGTNLCVSAIVNAKLIQNGEDVETEVIQGDDHEWDDQSTMWCLDCGAADAAGAFARRTE